MSDPTPRLEVIYDGECPFCTSYVEYCRLKEAFPDVTLTNARDIPDRVAAFRADGMDVDQGMIVIYGDAVYFGDKAMGLLARISRSGAFLQGILRFLFRWPALSVPVYVVLRTGRNLTLALLGRKKIGRAEKEGEA
jgi:predicted DCC family thiol-disulfide oxidoreductase YuxK